MADFISYKDYRWEYFVFGNGPETLFAFHGFDNDADNFRIFQNSLGKKYRVVAINLFFHGQSEAGENFLENDFLPEDLYELFNRFLFEFKCERFSFIGFSLGGRIILKLIEQFSDRIDRVILLAPDGLHISPWYRFVTHSAIGKWIFKRVVKNPSRFFIIARLFHKLKLIGDRQYAFVIANFDTAEKRQKVYHVWLIFRFIVPDIHFIRNCIETQQFRMNLFFGKYDTIIRPVYGINFMIGLEAPVTMEVLDMGHNLMKEKMNEELGKILD